MYSVNEHDVLPMPQNEPHCSQLRRATVRGLGALMARTRERFSKHSVSARETHSATAYITMPDMEIMHACSAGPEGRLACGEPSFTPTEHNHTCGELEITVIPDVTLAYTEVSYVIRRRT